MGKSYIGRLTCPNSATYVRRNGYRRTREISGVESSNCSIICECIAKNGTEYKFKLRGIPKHLGEKMAMGKATMWVSYIKDNVDVVCGTDGKCQFKIDAVFNGLDDYVVENIENNINELKRYCKETGLKNCNYDTFTLTITKTLSSDFVERINDMHGAGADRKMFAPTPKKRILKSTSHRALRNRPVTNKIDNGDENIF